MGGWLRLLYSAAFCCQCGPHTWAPRLRPPPHAYRYVQAGLVYRNLDRAALQAHVECVEDTQALREALPGRGLLAFVGDGAVLTR